MASFIPWYGKKRSRLAERERELLDVLRSNAGDARIANAVETIRIAHIRALKEKRQKFAPSEKSATVYEDIDQAIRWWSDRSADAIIRDYRDPKSWRRVSSAVRRTAK